MSTGKPFTLQGLPGHPAARRIPVQSHCADGSQRRTVWDIAGETPVEVGFNGKPWAVMLASPCDLEDLATGLSFTEGIIPDPAKIESFAICEYPEGVTVDLKVAPDGLAAQASRLRSLAGFTGCGLCGVGSLADAVRPIPARGGAIAIGDAAVARAFGELEDKQPLNAATRSVHAAAWCALDGHVLEVREDVGRHNALDKLIGALLRARTEPAEGFIVMTSRCSMELVQKTAAFGAPLLATISAPTCRALELAAAARLPVKCQGPENTVISFPSEAIGAES
jgi:FdhD protein